MTHIQPCEVVYVQQLRQRINDALQPGLNGTFAGSIDPVVPLLNQFEDKQGMPIMLLIESCTLIDCQLWENPPVAPTTRNTHWCQQTDSDGDFF